MPYALEKNDVAGAVVVVVKDGKVLLEKGYGYSDLAKRTPVDPERTLFRPGSVSKLFTWTAVMQLVEQGKIDLDQDVNAYLDFKIPPYQGKPVTMRNIMTHTAGFEEAIRGLIATDPKGIQPLGDTLKHWVPARVYAPGSTSAYSNYATAVAGYIVAAHLRRAVRPLHRQPHLRAAGHAALQLQPAAAARAAAAGVEGLQAGVRRQAEGVRVHQPRARRQPGRDRRRHGPLHDRPPAERRLRRHPHPARGHGDPDAHERDGHDHSAQPDHARLLRVQHQRPPRDRPRRRHRVVPQRSAAVPGRRHRRLRVDQQRRQGRRGARHPRCPVRRLHEALPARPGTRRHRRRCRDREAARAADRRVLRRQPRCGLELPVAGVPAGRSEGGGQRRRHDQHPDAGRLQRRAEEVARDQPVRLAGHQRQRPPRGAGRRTAR